MATVAAPTAVEPLYLAGEWVHTEDSFEVRSPYSGAVVATVAIVPPLTLRARPARAAT